MKVKIKSEEELNYETKGAVAFDLKASKEYIVDSGKSVLIDTGAVIKVPKGYVLNCYARSSTYKKLGLILVNSVGIIDQDYCGNEDTIKLMYLNVSEYNIRIEKGDRIGQGLFLKTERAEFEYVEDMQEENRGGFGTTGL